MYIVIETYDILWPTICVDKNGQPLIFNTREHAEELARDCHEPVIVQIG